MCWSCAQQELTLLGFSLLYLSREEEFDEYFEDMFLWLLVSAATLLWQHFLLRATDVKHVFSECASESSLTVCCSMATEINKCLSCTVSLWFACLSAHCFSPTAIREKHDWKWCQPLEQCGSTDIFQKGNISLLSNDLIVWTLLLTTISVGLLQF